jgi:hypothetical protein
MSAPRPYRCSCRRRARADRPLDDRLQPVSLSAARCSPTSGGERAFRKTVSAPTRTVPASSLVRRSEPTPEWQRTRSSVERCLAPTLAQLNSHCAALQRHAAFSAEGFRSVIRLWTQSARSGDRLGWTGWGWEGMTCCWARLTVGPSWCRQRRCTQHMAGADATIGETVTTFAAGGWRPPLVKTNAPSSVS